MAIGKLSEAYEAAMADKAYLSFRPRMFSSAGMSEEMFRKAAMHSISPMYWNEDEVSRAIRHKRMRELDGN